jgi:hypothetical protein
VQDAVRRISEHAVALARLEAELAKAELSAKGKRLGVAAGLGAGATVLAVIGLGFGLAAGAAALALAIPTWAALLAVCGGVVLVAAILAAVAIRSAKKASPPVPQQAIDEAKLTKDVLSGGANGG